jgi:YidC/Oxa1 family membrane protein insertase
MLSAIWNLILISPLLNGLVVFYRLTGNLGVAIIALTSIIRLALHPIMAPSIKSLKKQQQLQPELKALKEKYKYDQKKLAEKQMEIFKQHGINPATGCLSQIAMLFVLVALFSVIKLFTVTGDAAQINNKLYFQQLKLTQGETITTKFLYMDLAKPDPYFVLAILSGILQFIASKMMMPIMEKAEKAAEKTETKTDDIALQMQQQQLYMMPIMNVIIGVTLPSGVVLYIVTTTLFTIAQNYILNGWGGLKPLITKFKAAAKTKVWKK